ncbi:protein of unknown function [Methylorubrum extorquens DM4]|uniref:Uncharacterized protein n=1 Tax=Methylorubrum extorquens (strain DSM 6343 / CIP 106787 / DM4) TaxID=661410 RepID=C7CAT7_METED|nr:hypothetical protein [Methylorubrum extorquens]CAX24219.1 protein of unknown function [Methylorubrum extorquens DM4]
MTLPAYLAHGVGALREAMAEVNPTNVSNLVEKTRLILGELYDSAAKPEAIRDIFDQTHKSILAFAMNYQQNHNKGEQGKKQIALMGRQVEDNIDALESVLEKDASNDKA